MPPTSSKPHRYRATVEDSNHPDGEQAKQVGQEDEERRLGSGEAARLTTSQTTRESRIARPAIHLTHPMDPQETRSCRAKVGTRHVARQASPAATASQLMRCWRNVST